MKSSSSIKFCLTGRSGLGHLRRVANIATVMKGLSPQIKIHLVVNAPIAGLSRDEAAAFDNVCRADRKMMAATLAGLPAGPVVVDTAVVPGLGAIPDPLCLVLRETIAARLPAFKLDLGRNWNATIVPSPAGHWEFDPAAIGTDTITHVGWIYRQCAGNADQILPAADGRARLLIATGGGGTQQTAAALTAQIDPTLHALRRRLAGVTIIQVAGPRLHEDGLLAGADVRIDVGARLNDAFAEADAVITTVGYNSILELAQLDTPALLVPCERSLDDQFDRAAQWGPRLGRDHRSGDHEASAEWLADTLARRRRRCPYPLGENGAERAALAILSLTGQSKRDPQWVYSKAANPVTRKPDLHTARVSVELFRQGVSTLPSRFENSALVMSRVTGATLRHILAKVPRANAGPQAVTVIGREIGDALGPVVSLHRASSAGLDLPLANPLKKVWSRLDVAVEVQGESADEFLSRATFLAHKAQASVEACTALRKRDACVIHGDLHAGQFVREPSGNAWLLDLDDVAIGLAELDIANLAAHAVTSHDIFDGAVGTAFLSLSSQLARHYQRFGGGALDPNLIRVFGASSLLRRALKLREARRRKPTPDAILTATEEMLAAESPTAATRVAKASLHFSAHSTS